MCFSARYQMQLALRRAMAGYRKNEIGFLKDLIRQYSFYFVIFWRQFARILKNINCIFRHLHRAKNQKMTLILFSRH